MKQHKEEAFGPPLFCLIFFYVLARKNNMIPIKTTIVETISLFISYSLRYWPTSDPVGLSSRQMWDVLHHRTY